MSYQNTRDILGEQTAYDKLVGHELTSFVDDTITQIGQKAFQYQTQMEEICLPNIESIPANAFLNCTGMKRFKIALEKSNVITLNNFNAFTNTGRSVIYVPDALVKNYRSANTWSSLSGRIYGISDLGKYEWNETEIADDWATIMTNISNGTAENLYKPGNYKPINLGTEGTINFQIIGVNLDTLAVGDGTALFTWFPMNCLKTTNNMNPVKSGTTEGTGTIGGWEKCKMRTYLLETIWPLIPEVIRNGIKSVKKYTNIYNTSESRVYNFESSETLFLLTRREVMGGTEEETRGIVYSMAFPDAISRKRAVVGSTSASAWWLRTAYSPNHFRYISNSGNVDFDSSNYGKGVAFGFCT